jgi:hypothetical protein
MYLVRSDPSLPWERVEDWSSWARGDRGRPAASVKYGVREKEKRKNLT